MTFLLLGKRQMKRVIGTAVVSSILLVSGALAQTGGPIKIGNIGPFTGPLSGSGLSTRVGVEVALEEANYQAAGRKIVLLNEDDQFKADIALTAARKLIERDSVDVLLGPTGTHECVAMRSYMAEKGTPWIMTQCTGKEVSPPSKTGPNVFRTSFQYNQHHPIMAKYVFSKLGYKRIVAVGLDYAAGHDETRAFTDAFREAGGQVETVFIPIGAADPSPYVGRINPQNTDAVFVNMWGIDGARFIKAATEYGLTKRLPFFANGTAVEDADTLRAAGESAVGMMNYRTYSATHDTVLNKAFVARVQKKTGDVPNQYTYAGYLAAKAALQALEATGGKTDRSSLGSALRKVDFDAPGGRFKFDGNQQAIATIYIRRVTQKGGRLFNEQLEMIPDITAPSN
jgi:branched-chain amino acid transport system substrate-binding protein